MRKQRLVSLISALFVWTGALSASASTVNLIWVGASDPSAAGIGTSTVGVSSPNTTLTLDLVIGIDAAGLGAFGLDLEFDVGPEFDNELNIVSAQEFSWANAKATRTLKQLSPGLAVSQESGTGGPEGQLFGFDAFTLGSGPSNLTLSFARMVFRTTRAVQTDGFDLFSTLDRDPLATVFFDNSNNQISIRPLRAAVNLIPEPATAGLLGLGLAALAASSRARRQR